MRLTILTAEQSMELWNKEKEERRGWSVEKIIKDARMMMNMPDMGNTKWVLSKDLDDFYKWLESDEAKEQWDILPKTEHLARYYSINKTK